MIEVNYQFKLLPLLAVIFVTANATTLNSESSNQCRLELRCDGNDISPSFPVHNDNRPLGIGKAGPRGPHGQKGEPGRSCSAQDCLVKTAEFEEQILQLSSCLVEDIENANHNASSMLRHNDYVSYSCKDGFYTESIETRKCFMGRLVPSLHLHPVVCHRGCLVTKVKHASSSTLPGAHIKSNNSITYS